MSFDIIGPADAFNAVTTRPPEGRTFGAPDSWFKDCTSVDIDDGTEFRSDFFNGLLASLRGLWRVNGGTIADPLIKVVPEVGSDDYGITKAVQHLIQRAQPSYAVDTGAANAIVVTLSPAAAEYKAGMVVRPKIAFDNSGATTINVNGLGLRSIVHPDGRAVLKKELLKDMVPELIYDGAAFQLVGARVNQLSAAMVYYVNGTTGNDGNTGLSVGTAFATIQRAIDAANVFDPNGFGITIYVADGNYAPFSSGGSALTGVGTIAIIGNLSSPANVSIVSAQTCITISGKSRGYVIAGLKVSSTGSVSVGGTGILATDDANIGLYNIEFGYCTVYHMWASRALITLMGSIDGLSGAFLAISGSANAHMRASGGGAIGSHGPQLNFLTYVSFSNFAMADSLSELTVVSASGLWYSAISNYSYASGGKYTVGSNAIISTAGAGVNYFPGTVAGTSGTGGQYI